MPFTPSSYPGIVHRYTPRLTAYEFSTPALERTSRPPTLLFVGGLGDGLLSVPYITELLRLGWSVVQVLITSSNAGWGTGTIDRDAKELAHAISYFKCTLGRPKVVLMGHSTGCQDIMHYLSRLKPEERANGELDGAILQAPVSDREALIMSMGVGRWERGWKAAKRLIEYGRGDEIMSAKVIDNIFEGAVSANRWYSLTSPNFDTLDDFFSSDIPLAQLETTFGAIKPNTLPLLILYSGDDEFVPKHVDKKALVQKWIDVCVQNHVNVDLRNSGVVEGARHNFAKAEESVLADLKGRVGDFLQGVERGGPLCQPITSHM